MSLEREITGWLNGARREWETIEEQLPQVVERAHSGPARIAIEFWHRDLWDPVLATPARAGRELSPFVSIAEHAVADEQERLPLEGAISHVLLNLVDLCNALETVGHRVMRECWERMRTWLSRVQVTRDDELGHFYWTTGFAALALGDRLTYSRIAGYVGGLLAEPDPSALTEPRGRFSFQPGRKCQFNMQGLLRYLAGAVEQRAAFEDVVPAWEDLLWSYPALRASRSLDPGTLLWIARIVFHKVGGCPLGEVAQRLHDSAWTLAGLKP